jgi:hypothetical protein
MLAPKFFPRSRISWKNAVAAITCDRFAFNIESMIYDVRSVIGDLNRTASLQRLSMDS